MGSSPGFSIVRCVGLAKALPVCSIFITLSAIRVLEGLSPWHSGECLANSKHSTSVSRVCCHYSYFYAPFSNNLLKMCCLLKLDARWLLIKVFCPVMVTGVEVEALWDLPTTMELPHSTSLLALVKTKLLSPSFLKKKTFIRHLLMLNSGLKWKKYLSSRSFWSGSPTFTHKELARKKKKTQRTKKTFLHL